MTVAKEWMTWDIFRKNNNTFPSQYTQVKKKKRTWSMKESLQEIHTLNQLGKRRRVETLRMSALKSVRVILVY